MPTSKFRPRTPVVPCLLLILGFAVEMTDGPVARAADEHPAATTGTPAHLSPPVAVVTARHNRRPKASQLPGSAGSLR